MSDYSIEPTKREVIERKLLTALQQKDVCAALFCEQDLTDIILGLRTAIVSCEEEKDATRMRELADAMALLRKTVYNR